MAFGDYDFSLSAGGTVQLPVTGSVVRLRSATGQVRVSVDGGPIVTLAAGQGFRLKDGQTFRDVTIRDVSGSPNAGIVFIGDANYDDQTFQGQVTLSAAGGVTQAGANVTNASGQLRAANASRRYLLIQNTDTLATVYVTLDGTAATTAKGIKIGPGGSLELAVFAPIAAINAIADQPAASVVVVEG